MNKNHLSEPDICTKFITLALRRAGWDEMLQIREEVSFTKDRIIVRGKLVSRGKASGLKNLTTEYLKRLTVPLYPIAVQRRIVAKVDELMTFCDQLETSLTDTTATRRLLDEALEPAEKLAA